MQIEENETLEDLQIGGLKLLQKKDGFRFGLDAVLLADFAKDVKSDKTIDLCTGSGIIPILLSHKTKTEKIYGIEIQEEIYKVACRSVTLNELENRIFLKCGDLKDSDKIFDKAQFDLVTCNPPYMTAGAAIQNQLTSKIIARHEVMCTLDDVISASSKLLRFHGTLALVHKPTRLADILCSMRQTGIEPKKIRMVHKTPNDEPSLVLVRGLQKGGNELRIMPPLYLYDEQGNETEELKRIYGK